MTLAEGRITAGLTNSNSSLPSGLSHIRLNIQRVRYSTCVLSGIFTDRRLEVITLNIKGDTDYVEVDGDHGVLYKNYLGPNRFNARSAHMIQCTVIHPNKFWSGPWPPSSHHCTVIITPPLHCSHHSIVIHPNKVWSGSWPPCSHHCTVIITPPPLLHCDSPKQVFLWAP